MRLSVFLLLGACGSGLLFSGCESTPGVVEESTTASGFAPWTIDDHRMEYRDNHGSYTYTFFPDRRYRLGSLSQNGTLADTTQGTWDWKVLGPQQARLILDGGSNVLTLDFSSPQQATGSFQGDVRTYSFQIAKGGGE